MITILGWWVLPLVITVDRITYSDEMNSGWQRFKEDEVGRFLAMNVGA